MTIPIDAVLAGLKATYAQAIAPTHYDFGDTDVTESYEEHLGYARPSRHSRPMSANVPPGAFTKKTLGSFGAWTGGDRVWTMMPIGPIGDEYRWMHTEGQPEVPESKEHMQWLMGPRYLHQNWMNQWPHRTDESIMQPLNENEMAWWQHVHGDPNAPIPQNQWDLIGWGVLADWIDDYVPWEDRYGERLSEAPRRWASRAMRAGALPNWTPPEDRPPEPTDSRDIPRLKPKNYAAYGPTDYGQMPHQDITDLLMQHLGHAGTMEWSDADAILADMLADYEDPRELLLRRDLDHRSQGSWAFHSDQLGSQMLGTEQEPYVFFGHRPDVGREYPRSRKFDIPGGKLNFHPTSAYHTLAENPRRLADLLDRDKHIWNTFWHHDVPGGEHFPHYGTYMTPDEAESLAREFGHVLYPRQDMARYGRYDDGYGHPSGRMVPLTPEEWKKGKFGHAGAHYANYAAPEDEIWALAQGQAEGGLWSPDNFTDSILADKLADHMDPRELIVRRDMSYRGETMDQWWDRVNKHIADIAGVPAHTDLHGGEYRVFDLPHGQISVQDERIRNTLDDPKSPAVSHHVLWNPRPGPDMPAYAAAMSPEEVRALLEYFGIQFPPPRPNEDDRAAMNYEEEPPYEDTWDERDDIADWVSENRTHLSNFAPLPSQPMQYADPAGWQNLVNNPTSTDMLKIGSDWARDQGDDVQADLRLEMAAWLDQRLGTPWAPPEYMGGTHLFQPRETGFHWPAINTETDDSRWRNLLMWPRVRGDVSDAVPETAHWWWGREYPTGEEGYTKDIPRSILERNAAMRINDLTPIERAYAGITPMGDVTGMQWASIVNLMEQRKRELGRFEDDGDPTNYGTDDELRAAIHAQPWEIGNHMAMSDWHQEHGDANLGDFHAKVADWLPDRLGHALQVGMDQEGGWLFPDPQLREPFELNTWVNSIGGATILDRLRPTNAYGGPRWGLYGDSTSTRSSRRSEEHLGLPSHSLSDYYFPYNLPSNLRTPAHLMTMLSPEQNLYLQGVLTPDTDPDYWPALERILRDRHTRGQRFDDDGQPTNYNDEEAFLRTIAETPQDVYGHQVFADMLQDRLGEEHPDVRFRRNLADLVQARQSYPIHDGDWANHPRGFSPEHLGNIHTWSRDWDDVVIDNDLRPSHQMDPDRHWGWRTWAQTDLGRRLSHDQIADATDWYTPEEVPGQLFTSWMDNRLGHRWFNNEELRSGLRLTTPELGAFDIRALQDIDPDIWPQVEALLRSRWNRRQAFAEHDQPTAYGAAFLNGNEKLPQDLQVNEDPVRLYPAQHEIPGMNYSWTDEDFTDAIQANPLELTHHNAYEDWLNDQGRDQDAQLRRVIADAINRRLGIEWQDPEWDGVGGMTGAVQGPGYVPQEHTWNRTFATQRPYVSHYKPMRATGLSGTFDPGTPIWSPFATDSTQDWQDPMSDQDLRHHLNLGPDEEVNEYRFPNWHQFRRLTSSTIPRPRPGMRSRGSDDPLYMQPHERAFAGIDDFRDVTPEMWPYLEELMKRQHGRGLALSNDDQPTNYGAAEDLAALHQALRAEPASQIHREVAADLLEEYFPSQVHRPTLDFLRTHPGRAWLTQGSDQRWYAGESTTPQELVDRLGNRSPSGFGTIRERLGEPIPETFHEGPHGRFFAGRRTPMMGFTNMEDWLGLWGVSVPPNTRDEWNRPWPERLELWDYNPNQPNEYTPLSQEPPYDDVINEFFLPRARQRAAYVPSGHPLSKEPTIDQERLSRYERTDYGTEEELIRAINDEPREVSAHLGLADWYADNDRVSDELYRRALADSLQRRLSNKWTVPKFNRWGEMTSPGSQGPPNPPLVGLWWPDSEGRDNYPDYADHNSPYYHFREINRGHNAGIPPYWYWSYVSQSGDNTTPFGIADAIKVHADDMNRFMMPDWETNRPEENALTIGEEYFAGLRDINNLTPSEWPGLEDEMAWRWRAGQQLEEGDVPTAYGTREDENAFIQGINQNPLELTNHQVFADWLADQDRPEDEAFRRRVAEWVPWRMGNPAKWTGPGNAGWLDQRDRDLHPGSDLYQIRTLVNQNPDPYVQWYAPWKAFPESTPRWSAHNNIWTPTSGRIDPSRPDANYQWAVEQLRHTMDPRAASDVNVEDMGLLLNGEYWFDRGSDRLNEAERAVIGDSSLDQPWGTRHMDHPLWSHIEQILRHRHDQGQAL